jgi:hypothetical protein
MNIVQIQSRVQEMPNSPQTMQYLNAAMNGQVTTVPPYIAAAELKRRETEGMMDQLAKGAAQAQQTTVKDQLQQKMGIMALMGQQQPPQPPQIPQPAPPEQQPQAAGIDSLPVKEDMFGMAGGGIVAFDNGGKASVPYGGYGGGPSMIPAKTGYEGMGILEFLKAFGSDVLAKLPSEEKTRLKANQQKRDAEGEANMRNYKPRPTMEQGEADIMYENIGMEPRAPQVQKPVKPPAPPAAAGPRPPAPQNAGPAEAPQSAQGIQKIIENSPEFQRMMQGVTATNPYGGPQEAQGDYIKRRTEGIRSQMPGGQMPYETSEARLKEIEARRAKEDTEYAESNKGRQLDNLLTMISGMGRGSFGNAGMQGIQAVQGVERSQREEDLRRKDLRDQQSIKLMEIRTLNEQAQMALAQGNVQAYEKLTQEAKKLKIDFDKDQAVLAKGAATLRTSAAEKDLESTDKAKDRASRERSARMAQDARAAGAESKEIAAAEAAFARDPEAAAIRKRLEVPFGSKEAKAGDLARLRQIQADKYAQFGIKLEGAPGAQSPSGNTRMRFDAKGNPI